MLFLSFNVYSKILRGFICWSWTNLFGAYGSLSNIRRIIKKYQKLEHEPTGPATAVLQLISNYLTIYIFLKLYMTRTETNRLLFLSKFGSHLFLSLQLYN